MPAPLIAVVEDDAATANLLRDILHERGFRVIVCRTTAECEAMLTRERPHLLLLDLRLEESCSGLAILQTVRANPETAAIPCIMCSADTVYLREHAAELRVLDCEPLAKPFALDNLLTLVPRLLAAHP